MGAVRQGRGDRWRPSPAVLRYRAYRDELKIKGVTLPAGAFAHMVFVLPMSPSWSAKKRAAMEGFPHLYKPDRDNLEKAVLDALLDDDAHIWNGSTSKFWGRQGLLLISDGPIWFSGNQSIDLTRAYAWAARWRVGDVPLPANMVLGPPLAEVAQPCY